MCPYCKGAGFVYPDVPPGHPDFGRAVPCYCLQKERQGSLMQRLQRYSNLGALTRFTFDTLIPQGRSGNPANQNRFQRACQGAKNFAQNPDGWLVFIGPSGCGKTHLAVAIANYRIQQGYPTFFVVVPDLLDHLRATFGPTSEVTYDELFEQVRNAPLLILDDLGTQTNTPWAQEKLFQIINHRYSAQLPTVITMNTSLEELEERLYARLSEPTLSQVYLVEEREASELEHLSELGLKLLTNMTFRNFDFKRVDLPVEQRYTLEHAYQLAYNFAQAPEGWLIFQGTNGCGKTHLAVAIANYCLEHEREVLFIPVPDFLDHLRSCFSPDSGVRYDELLERTKKSPLLILDDFGEESSTPWVREKLYQLINYRYIAQLPTVVTTSFSLDEFESRISSRMADPRLSVVFNITAPDYRTDRPLPEKGKSLKGYSHRRRMQT